MEAIRLDRSAKWYVLASIAFLLVWQLGALAGVPRRMEVVFGLYGFVLHMVFGKGYSLIPSYFARELRHWQAPVGQFPLTTLGTAAMGVAPILDTEVPLALLGGAAWTAGVVVFVLEVGWTVRDNLTGAETGTSDANIERATVDRVANAFMPVALAYLLLGSYETLAVESGLPGLVAYPPAVTHVLAAGTGGLLVFAVGFRLLPRFMVAHPPQWLVWIVLPFGAVAPLALAVTLGGSDWVPVAAAIEAIAIAGFAVAIWALFRRSDRRRVGFYGVVTGAGFGVFAAGLGAGMVLDSVGFEWALVHLRVNLLGFLGLTIIGVAYQFYPPSIGTAPFVGDRAALGSIVGIALGLVAQVLGVWSGLPPIELAGMASCVLATGIYGYVIGAVFRAR